MANGNKVWSVCPDCRGTGKNRKFVADEHGQGEPQEENCSRCEGKKYVFFGWIQTSASPMPTNLPEPPA